MPEDAPAPSEERLMQRLRALASPVRLQILRSLVVPERASGLRVRAGGERAGLGSDRFVARTTVIEHLGVLEEAGLVRRIGESYVVDQQAMVSLLQELGDLARLRALVEVDVESTMAAPLPSAVPVPAPPRLLVVNGPEAGRAVGLAGAGPWRVGRAGECELALRHDPHVSRVHLTLSRDGDRFVGTVAEGAKNPVYVDFSPLPAGTAGTLAPGCALLVGATLLVLQA